MILTGSLISLLSEIFYYCAFIPFNFFSNFSDIFSFLIFLGALCLPRRIPIYRKKTGVLCLPGRSATETGGFILFGFRFTPLNHFSLFNWGLFESKTY